MLSPIVGILQEHGYITHAFNLDQPTRGNLAEYPSDPMISVGEKISAVAVKQLANSAIESGRVRFYSGNGYIAQDRQTCYSTYAQDGNAAKFVEDFQRFVSGMALDSYGSGFLIKRVGEF